MNIKIKSLVELFFVWRKIKTNAIILLGGFMNFLKDIEGNSILVIPSKLRSKVLDYIDKQELLLNIKILTFSDLKKGLLFDYNNEAINYVMRSRNVGYNVARDLINNIYFLNKNTCEEKKLQDLLHLKKQLVNNNLLICDKLFINLLKSKKALYVFGFDALKKFDLYLLDLAQEYIDIHKTKKTDFNYTPVVYEFNTIIEEATFVFEEIAKLIEKGIGFEHIYIANYSDEYYFTFKMLAKQYNLPIFIKSETTLYQTAIGQYFIDNLIPNLDLLMYKIKKRFDSNNPFNANVINKLASLLNTYYWCSSIMEIKDLVIEEMKTIRIAASHFSKEIVTTDIRDNVFTDDDYVFLIGFNLGVVPKFKRDEDYISDDIKPDFLETADEYNNLEKKRYVSAIRNIKNLVVTYKLSSSFKSYSPSFLIDDEGFDVVSGKKTISKYSIDKNKLQLATEIDKLIKFNEYSEELEILYNNYFIPYKSYDNAFSGINSDNLKKNIDDKIVFSYSNISKYYECPFKFYVSSILKIADYETTLEQTIGNLFHYTLERVLNGTMDADDAYNEYLVNNNLLNGTSKDNFFFELLRPMVHFVLDTIEEQYTHSKHNDATHEKEIIIEIERDYKTKLKGFVDKILVLNNYLLIIDYKTTNAQAVDSDLFDLGVSLQLPIYLYLLKCLDKSYEVAGLYIQHILDLNNEYMPNKDILSERKRKLRLEGITFDDINLISKFDDSYEKSQVIKSLSTKDGFIRKNKNVLSLEERDELIELMDSLIMGAIDNVGNALFSIHPIKVESKNIDGCKYCQYKDICFRKFKDFNYKVVNKKGGDEVE